MAKHPQNEKTPSLPHTEVTEATDLEDEIDRLIGSSIPQKQRELIVARITTLMVSESFSGPLPHPKHMSGYEQIAPGAAERILKMAENRQNHHHQMDQDVLNAEVADRKLGMLLGAAAFSLLVGGAIFTGIWMDSEVVPGLFLGAAALGAVGLFVKGRSNGS